LTKISESGIELIGVDGSDVRGDAKIIREPNSEYAIRNVMNKYCGGAFVVPVRNSYSLEKSYRGSFCSESGENSRPYAPAPELQAVARNFRRPVSSGTNSGTGS